MSKSTTSQKSAWHAEDVEDVLRELGSSRSGLSSEEALARLKRDGANVLPEPPRASAFARFLRHFHNILIYVLIVAGGVSLALGHLVDAVVIAAVVIFNAGIGFLQEGRAEQALEAIRAMMDPHASVLRDGRRISISAADIVRGDVVLIEAGDRVPADLRILHCRNLRIDEAALTGESAPVEKHAGPAPIGAPLAERSSMAYSGCFVAAGQGVAVAVETGGATEFGRVGAMLTSVESLRTPLLAQMDQFGRHITVAILALAAFAFAFAVFVHNLSLPEAFMAVVGLAVAAIPEGLPAIMTITLSIGVQRMASRNAIIRKLPAVETLGSVSVICSDKTGTLTRNEMTARSIMTSKALYEATGEGYAPEGSILRAGESVIANSDPSLKKIAEAAILCNDADIRQEGRDWIVEGDPMEGALLAMGGRAGLTFDDVRSRQPRRDEIPFDSQHRFMATLHGDQNSAFAIVKGAPERVLAMCSNIRVGHLERPIETERWLEKADELAAQGQRVLAFATKSLPASHEKLHFADVEDGLALLALVGFIDPPRAEALEAIAECHAAGIRVVMITGDHAATAREIGQMLGLARDPSVRTGADIDQLNDAELARVAHETTIFARTTPEHKLRLVTALQADGLTVAMTGDGVNDAPALKRADVGVAMGRKGTEAAKQAAEMVVADDNFASIVAAVREGRTVYDNLIKVIGWTLPTNGGEALTILAAIAFGATLPLTPVQILWVNLITAVALGTTLAFEPPEPGLMKRPPRPRTTKILSPTLIWRISFVSVLFVAGAFGVFEWAQRRGLGIETARTLVVNTMVAMEIFYLFSIRYAHGPSATWAGVLGTPAVLIGVGFCVLAQIAFTYAPWFNAAFASTAISLTDALVVIGIGVLLFVAVEIEKGLRRALLGSK
ncbi:MAG: HAD-IC family P-type ATPase [Beijerinckiaceae bacterium]